MKQGKYKKTYLYLWLLLSIGLAIVVGISLSDNPKIGNMELTKATFPDVIFAPENKNEEEKSALHDTIISEEEILPSAESSRKVVVADPDTTVETVLIFGDSMTILVANRMAAYGEKNGYQVASVTWDGSSSIAWSSCDTLDRYIERYKPGFIMVTLGSNELFLKNFDKRKPYVEKLVDKFGDIPFVWIGPPNWKEDVGYNAMMESVLPQGTYFDSNGLDLPRGADHIHPTPKGGIIWTDSIMRWMRTTPHPIRAQVPDSSVRTRAHSSHYFKAK